MMTTITMELIREELRAMQVNIHADFIETYEKLECRIKNGFIDLNQKIEAQQDAINKCAEQTTEVERKHVVEQRRNQMAVCFLEQKIIALEKEARKNNLIFYGVPMQLDFHNDTENTEDIVRQCMSSKLGVKVTEIDAAYRLVSKKDSAVHIPPIFVAFMRSRDRQAILNNVRRLKGTGITVAFDLPPLLRMVRNKLNARRREALSQGKQAFFRRSQLIVNEDIYDWDFATGTIQCVGRYKVSSEAPFTEEVDVETLVNEEVSYARAADSSEPIVPTRLISQRETVPLAAMRELSIMEHSLHLTKESTNLIEQYKQQSVNATEVRARSSILSYLGTGEASSHATRSKSGKGPVPQVTMKRFKKRKKGNKMLSEHS